MLATDSLIASIGDTSWVTSTGITRKVARFQAMPTSPMTIRPRVPERLDRARRRSPTVAAIAAQPRIEPRREKAMRSPSRTVGSPPSKRIIAAPTSAELKKNITVYCTR